MNEIGNKVHVPFGKLLTRIWWGRGEYLYCFRREDCWLRTINKVLKGQKGRLVARVGCGSQAQGSVGCESVTCLVFCDVPGSVAVLVLHLMQRVCPGILNSSWLHSVILVCGL